MQDEISKHTKKIYNTMKDQKYTIGEKVREITIEIFVIVFAVTLSIWLHSWSEHRREQHEVIEFFADLKDDLNRDIKSMADEKVKLSKTVKDYTFIEKLTAQKMDSIISGKVHFSFDLTYIERKTNGGNYEGFKSSGKIGFIENKKLKKLILGYYQESMPSAEAAEKYYNLQITKIGDMATQSKEKKKMLLDPVFKMLLDFAVQSANGNIKSCDDITKQAKEILAEIDKQTKE